MKGQTVGEAIAAALASGQAVEGASVRIEAAPPRLAADVSEKDFQQTVIELAQNCGWMVAHFRPVRIQRADGSVYYETPAAADGAGFPDLVLVRDRVIFAELKAQKGRLSEGQLEWKAALLGAGAVWRLWRPSDIETIHEELR